MLYHSVSFKRGLWEDGGFRETVVVGCGETVVVGIRRLWGSRWFWVLRRGSCTFFRLPLLPAHPEDFGVAINIFWRHLPADAYDPKDVYGNRDPVPAARVLQSLDKNLQTLDKLPDEYRDFYARRMIARIKEKFRLQDN